MKLRHLNGFYNKMVLPMSKSIWTGIVLITDVEMKYDDDVAI
jgi:hypothetical protein